ncbi:hypothetical protein C8Q76DRAFT_735214 [Earliella scabrosa]|nr:hypothetical protein C8Q76DRAFT_735214 [Earliella scabrosa]
MLLMPVSTLLAVAQRSRCQTPPGRRGPSVAWDQWGSFGTRLIHTVSNPDFSVLGSELVAAFYLGSAEGPTPSRADVTILDLNPMAPPSDIEILDFSIDMNCSDLADEK